MSGTRRALVEMMMAFRLNGGYGRFLPDKHLTRVQSTRAHPSPSPVGGWADVNARRFKMLTPTVLLERLAQRHHHLLAIRICELLGLSAENILHHWACTKVRPTSDPYGPISFKEPGCTRVRVAVTALLLLFQIWFGLISPAAFPLLLLADTWETETASADTYVHVVCLPALLDAPSAILSGPPVWPVHKSYTK